MSETEVFDLLTPVKIGTNFDIDAVITSVAWRTNGICYEVTWWYESSHNTAWLPESEFKTDTQKTEFGFKNGHKDDNKMPENREDCE